MALFGNAYWASIEVKEFNVDEFIESVYQEFAGTEHEESREDLMDLWTKVLSVTSPRGDASLYPNNNGKHRAAAMKVWHKAGDFWRAKYRLGDKLLCDQHGIALTKNDLASIAKAHCSAEEGRTEDEGRTDSTDGTDNMVAEPQPEVQQEPKPEPKAEPQQLDLFAMQARPQRRQRRRREPSVVTTPIHQQGGAGGGSVALDHPLRNVMRMAAIGAAMVCVGVLLMETGLIIPVGVAGLLIGGVLK